MQYSTLVVAALAGLSASQEAPRDIQAVQVLVRGITTIQASSNGIKRAALVEKRDTSACVSAAAEFTKDVNTDDIPTLPASLGSDIASYQLSHTIDVCTPSFTGSLSSAYSSYTEEASSWISKNKGPIKSFYSACATIPAFSSALSAVVGECTGNLAQITGGSSSSDNGNNSGDDKDGAAPGVAVPVLGMALVAGLVGFAL